MFVQKKYVHILYVLIVTIFSLICIFLLVKLFPFYQKLLIFAWQIATPFLIALLIAYLIYPFVQWLHTYQIPKALAVIIIFSLFFLTIGLLIYRAYPTIMFQLTELNEQLPELIKMYETMIVTIYDSTAFFPDGFHEQLDQFIVKIESNAERMLGKLLDRSVKVVDLFIIISLIPVLVFYFLKDYDLMKRFLKQFIPMKYFQNSKMLVKALDQTLGKYIRAQIIISLFITLTTYLCFHLLDLNYALLLAIIIGITNIIPYFGPIIGAIPAIFVAITVSYKLVIFVIIIIFIIQMIEGNFLSPYIVGKSINIHPVIIILALLIGGKISGVLGMILAVPFLTVVKVLMNEFLLVKTEH